MQALEDKLKYLRLSAIRASIETRNQYAIEHQLSYMEFFEMLIEDECANRKSNALRQRMLKSKLKTNKTLDNFDFAFQPELDKKLIQELMGCRFIPDKKNIVFMGKPGVGKTHLANAIGMQALMQGYNVFFAHVHTLLNKLQQGRIDGSNRRLLNQACSTDLLILDELGFRTMPPQCLDDFFELIRDRYENKPTIFTSNRNFEDWSHIFGDKVLAGAIIDRIVHHAYIIRITGDSYRVKDFIQQSTIIE